MHYHRCLILIICLFSHSALAQDVFEVRQTAPTKVEPVDNSSTTKSAKKPGQKKAKPPTKAKSLSPSKVATQESFDCSKGYDEGSPEAPYCDSLAELNPPIFKEEWVEKDADIVSDNKNTGRVRLGGLETITNNCEAYINAIPTCDNQDYCNSLYDTCKFVCEGVGKAGACYLPTVSNNKTPQLSASSVKEETKYSSTTNMGKFEDSNLSEDNTTTEAPQNYINKSTPPSVLKPYSSSGAAYYRKSSQGSKNVSKSQLSVTTPQIITPLRVNLPQVKIEVLTTPKQSASASIPVANNKSLSKEAPTFGNTNFQNSPGNFTVNINNIFGFAQTQGTTSSSNFGDETPLQLKAKEMVQKKKAEELRVAEIKYQQQLMYARSNNSVSFTKKSDWQIKTQGRQIQRSINWTDKLRAWIFGKRAQRSIAAYDSPDTTGITPAEGPSNFQKVASRYKKLFSEP